MKRFKNRTIALILASTVAVAGAFGAENYKNTIKSLEFKSGENGNISMMMYTRTNYTGSLNLRKQDASTYIIMLPDINSEMVTPPKLSENVQNVDVKTMPYTPNGNGYTKITVKTSPNAQLTAQPAIYIENNQKTEALTDNANENTNKKNTDSPASYNTQNNNTQLNNQYTEFNNQPAISTNSNTGSNLKNQNYEINHSQTQTVSSIPDELNNMPANTNKKNKNMETPRTITGTEIFIILAGIVVVIGSIAYFFMQSKAKMTEMLGEQINIEFDEEDDNEKKGKKKKKKNIKETINTLDKMYTNSYTNSLSKISQKNSDQNNTENKKIEQETSEKEDDIIVDLDELFKEATEDENSEAENSDLDDFLRNFEFNDGASERQKEIELVNLINTELYDKFINDNSLRFSKDDIKKIEKLLNSEVSEEAMQSLMSLPIAPIKPSPTKQERFEDIITTLSIDRQIKFSETDIASIKSLMNVELDRSFVTDLRTNPTRTEAVGKEIRNTSYGPAHNVSEILTLNVKDMLPNLSEELKKYDGKEIKSEAKPNIVYYSEGFEVSTLSVKNDLPDLEKEKYNDSARQYRPSDNVDIALSGYDVSTINVSTMLPDLDDVMAHPEKYKEKAKKEEKVDEEALLNSISNVKFKPFFDNNSEIEILNKFEEEEEENKNSAEDKKENEEEEEKINEIVSAKNIEQAEHLEPKVKQNTQNITKNVEQKQICLVENKTYSIASTVEFGEESGCYLAQNGNEYAVIGYIGDRTFIIKTYEELKSKRIHARINETFEDGSKQYLIKIGLTKFVLNVTSDSMNWVMDLC